MSTVRQYALCDVRDEVKALVAKGLVGRQHRIYALCSFFSDREWSHIEKILDANEYVLRDAVVDLIGQEVWSND